MLLLDKWHQTNGSPIYYYWANGGGTKLMAVQYATTGPVMGAPN